jgi:hypothetical protein
MAEVRDGVQQGEKGQNGVQPNQQNRTYNPVNDATRGTVSDKLNGDSSKYRKGPNPQTF